MRGRAGHGVELCERRRSVHAEQVLDEDKAAAIFDVSYEQLVIERAAYCHIVTVLQISFSWGPALCVYAQRRPHAMSPPVYRGAQGKKGVPCMSGVYRGKSRFSLYWKT